MEYDNIRFVIQNAGWAVLNPSRVKEVQAAMAEYRKSHPVCEITGSKKKVQIHHIVSIWANPDLAANQDNFIALSASAHIHLIYGHDGNFGKKYVSNIKEIAEKMRAIKSESIVVHRDSINTIKAYEGFWSTLISKLFS